MTDVGHMSEIRDVRLAQEFAQMAAQGYLDREFTVYGCGYWPDDQRRYMISSKAEVVYDFMAEGALKGWLPTPMMHLRKVCPVPLGQGENILQQVKVQLAKQLQKAYPVGFFEQLQQMDLLPVRDEASEILLALQQRLRGRFSQEGLALFEGLIGLAFTRKALSRERYGYFRDWILDERTNMADDAVVKDVFEVCFYGFAYEKRGGQHSYVSNACRESVYRRQTEVIRQGCLVSPIVAKRYWYNYVYRLSDALADYKGYLRRVLDEEYMAMIRAIDRLPIFWGKGDFEQQLAQCYERYGVLAGEAMADYGRMWRVY